MHLFRFSCGFAPYILHRPILQLGGVSSAVIVLLYILQVDIKRKTVQLMDRTPSQHFNVVLSTLFCSTHSIPLGIFL